MINVIITGHGLFASGMLDALQQIIGQQVDIEAINFTPDMGTDELKASFQQALQRLPAGSATMCYCDLLGGSPFRCAVELSVQHPNMRVIAGTNLQMLVESLMERDTVTDINEYADMTKACGIHGIVLFEPKLSVKAHSECSEEGI